MNQRILIALTSHDDLGGVEPTGYYVPEAAHPWEIFRKAGYEVDVASVRGGRPPQDGFDAGDQTQVAFLAAIEEAGTGRLADVDASRYDAVLYAGGHGTMWDFPDDPDVIRVGREVYERGGVVAAVCHGPSALVNLTLSDGSYLVAGKRVAAFTNEEERLRGVADVVPFLLADKLVERGAEHEPGATWQAQVVVDGRLATGQNPASAAPLAERVLDVLAERRD
ncbi:type 1 glutamine amidotransferase domain-containing protein [Nonomuraea angiospora]|uniref:Intracellular protease/amidase n=1 Tax=Nonomuraea angiospora TaxID=46172 RepID=A0ABR9ME94_9ACTN|nr:type 1 glutamine amidotransferase domain-containing protein [Nonomuraea angiospora]MBE1591119.1 putative intracellular protease/amidase [Nonomuraea angiospora]